jgi:protein gp37
MSDLFHEQNPEAWIDSIFAIAALSRQHTFQILTKRPLFAEAYFDVVGRKKRILERANQIDRLSSLPWPLPNVWLGTSVENDSVSGRIMLIKGVKAALHFASVEPLLMRLNKKTLSLLSELDWVIIGGESGGGARPLHVEWVRDIVELLEKKDGVSCFVKQLGSQPYFGMRKLRLKSRKGSDPSEWPIEFPRDFPLKK